jgi:superfamily II RNA helicase
MKNKRSHYRKPKRTRFKKPERSLKRYYENCRLDPALKHAFSKIGIPESGSFTPDLFQLEALEKLRDSDVLVSAPTGSGKTWIASRAIEQYLMKGLRVWYASPLKALSNSLYQEFSREFGPGSCGILTGERKENPEAPIIVGTTEILRNQLYDSMHEGTDIGADLVILDEAHYLSDPDRGVVWEEVLIYLPSRVRLLLLSATISNADEVCAWLRQNRGTRSLVVLSHERPVPLEMLFLFPDGLIAPLAGRKGLTARVNKFLASRMVRGKLRGQGKPRFGDIISCLRDFDLLPAIFFLKSRADCDQALEICPYSKRKGDIIDLLRKEVKAFLREYPHLKGHRHMGPLLDSLVASHHAGQLPYWKILIERLMNKGCLDAIFSTSTVAAGVNFPARSVALVQSDRYNGHEFTDLTATDLHQMIGRAGRRGMDNIGFALIIPGLHQDPRLIHELMDSPPEPLVSRIHINFSMTLNLLLSHSPGEVKSLLELSFANYQHKSSGSSIQRSLSHNMEGTGQGLWISFKRHLRFLKKTYFVDEKDCLTADGIWASKLRLDQPLLIAEAIRKGGFDSLSPEVIAGCIALFVWDREQDVELRMENNEAIKDIEDGAGRVVESMEDVRRLKIERGFENPPILFWPAVALFLWARGASWEHLLKCVPIGEGDMASMIVRTADHLRQVANLKETHPGLAVVAKKAIGLILREPVLIP